MVDRPTAVTSTSTVLVEDDDGVATLMMIRPERRNAISWRLLVVLAAVLEDACVMPQVEVIVLTGVGSDFCVCADLARVASDRRSDQDTRSLRGRSRDDDVERLTFVL